MPQTLASLVLSSLYILTGIILDLFNLFKDGLMDNNPEVANVGVCGPEAGSPNDSRACYSLVDSFALQKTKLVCHFL
jgi:hypothetical protein